MENINLKKICSSLISNLPQRQKEVISRRFGLNGQERETLELIGKDFGVCRERIRQIQEVSLEKIKPKVDKYEEVFQSFLKYFKKFGDLKKEDVLLDELSQGKWKNEVYFLLSQRTPFQRLPEDEEFHSLWLTNPDSLQSAKKIIDSFYSQLQKSEKPLALKDFNSSGLEKTILASYLEISKIIQQNAEGFYGLKDWPEINPRGVKDRAYLIFKKLGKPLHFTQVSNLIEGSHLQTVHNELIKDSRFVLIGRGTYALRDWGYYPGQVKDVISRILSEEKKPLTKKEILEKVSKQRIVKTNTILLNLSNKKYFAKDSLGRYIVKEA